MAPRAKAEPAPEVEEQAENPEHRFEEFERERPDGAIVLVRRNIDTGEQTVTEITPAPADESDEESDDTEDGE